MKRALTLKQTRFAAEAFRTGKLSDAYRLAYNTENMSDSSIVSATTELMSNPLVQAYINRREEDAAYVASLDVAWVLKQWMAIATADPNALVSSKRVCCRHCHGVGHAYQWLDENEYGRALAEVLDFNADQQTKSPSMRRKPRPVPDVSGGFGYWGTKEPHPKCPQCFGDGQQYVHVADTRKLPVADKILYAGVKQTKDGVQVLMRDQDGALANLARFLGIDKKSLEISGPGGKPIPAIVGTMDAQTAAQMYQAAMASTTAEPDAV